MNNLKNYPITVQLDQKQHENFKSNCKDLNTNMAKVVRKLLKKEGYFEY